MAAELAQRQCWKRQTARKHRKKKTPPGDRLQNRINYSTWNCQELEPIVDLHWKRELDLLLLLLMLPVALMVAPFLCCWIQLVSPGPCLFRQTRIGRGGRPFTMFKFRTMRPGAETAIHETHVTRLIEANQPLIKLDGADDRLIKGGWIIRKLGFDELPQLINVLRGEMSVVGPRPCLPSEFQLYDLDYYRRFAVQPGLTGVWQVDRTRSTTFHDMEEMDIGYVDHLSPWTDIKIVAKTPVSLVLQGGWATGADKQRPG
jgi:lipopolysaccharide/colanic/teichoic acid biosynthesis glycosyltransferase